MEATKDLFIHQKLGINKKHNTNKGVLKYAFVRDVITHCETNDLPIPPNLK